MTSLLTEGSTIKCSHQGTVQAVASQTQLHIDGKSVLVHGDLDGASISGCSTPDDLSHGMQPCRKVASMMIGAATKMKIGGKAVLLETANGLTDGLPAGANLWSVQSAGQTKLSAI